ncbi:baseplate J/gp47 family protein [Wukongibacter sp. M2B1]|uniref:baseplate J/gp47 family protein n=1 Tax=Wukongibacter sp. M2B1 TaxID=3088895 RepID=UPI003D79A8AB
MSLTSKTQSEIVEEMLIDFANELGVSTISEASDIAIKAKVYAAQIEGIYYNQEFIMKQSNPLTATGTYQDDWAKALDVEERKAATKAIGKVKIGRKTASENDILIPKGTMFSTDLDLYGKLIKGVTTEDGTLLAGNLEIEINAEAEEPGEDGNVPSGSFIILNNPPVGIETVTNTEPFTDGTEIEDDETFRDRFEKAKFNGTDDAFANRAKEVPGITYAKTLENNRGPGTADILVATASGIPSDELIAEVLTHVLDKRPICCDLSVIKPSAYIFDADIQVTLEDGFTLDSIIDGIALKDKIKDAVREYLKTVGIGGIIRKVGIESSVFALDKVNDVTITNPSANIQLQENETIQEGDINVT